MVGADRKTILERVPYAGLDIESVEGDTVRLEYSPNRPDFGTDYGIARSLRGLLGKEKGLPRFGTAPSGVTVTVDPRLSKVRPHIALATAMGMKLDEEDVRQMISLQEDLHNGLGRKRKVVAIGLHDLDRIKAPLNYGAVRDSFAFVPLGASSKATVGRILRSTTEGRSYGSALPTGGPYPMITDAEGAVLSFPPVINGSKTKVTERTRNLLVDVTSTDRRLGDAVLSIMATTLAQMGASIGTVKVKLPSATRTTPNLSPTETPLDLELVRSTLGLDLSRQEIAECLARSRLSVSGSNVLVPAYRVDILHPVDIAEEVALGYGVDKIPPEYPPSKRAGAFNPFQEFLDSTATVMAGSGMVEMMTFELADNASLYERFGRPSQSRVAVMDPKSLDHSVLRDSLIPTLMAALTSNVKSDYPQRVFEVGRVFFRSGARVGEGWRLGCLLAHSGSNFSEAKMHAEALCRILAGKEATSIGAEHWAFSPGRTASLALGGKRLGVVGEVRPEVLESFGLRVPVSGFELDLSSIYEQLK